MAQDRRPDRRKQKKKRGVMRERRRAGRREKTDQWSEFVYERFQGLLGDIGGQIDGWC